MRSATAAIAGPIVRRLGVRAVAHRGTHPGEEASNVVIIRPGIKRHKRGKGHSVFFPKRGVTRVALDGARHAAARGHEGGAIGRQAARLL